MEFLKAYVTMFIIWQVWKFGGKIKSTASFAKEDVFWATWGRNQKSSFLEMGISVNLLQARPEVFFFFQDTQPHLSWHRKQIMDKMIGSTRKTFGLSTRLHYLRGYMDPNYSAMRCVIFLKRTSPGKIIPWKQMYSRDTSDQSLISKNVADIHSAILGFHICDLAIINKIDTCNVKWVSYMHSGFFS